MATKSMQRSLKLIKENRWLYYVTETWNHYSKKRGDLFGFCDVLCLDGERTVAVQACGADYQEHVRKIHECYYVVPWLEAGNEIQIWSWRKYLKKRGGKAKEWRVNIAEVLLLPWGELYIEETWKK